MPLIMDRNHGFTEGMHSCRQVLSRAELITSRSSNVFLKALAPGVKGLCKKLKALQNKFLVSEVVERKNKV